MRKKSTTKFSTLVLALGALSSLSLPVLANEKNQVGIPLDLKEPREQKIKELSFKQIQRKAFPITEEMIREFRENTEEMERVANTPLNTPNVQNRTIKITPSITQSEQVVLSSANYTTNLIFVDSMGNPWPIKKYGIGAAEFFTVDQYLPHALMIHPKMKYTKSNITVILDGIETIPVVMSLVEDPTLVDYIVQVKINGRVGGNKISSGYSQQMVGQSLIGKSDGLLEHERSMSDGITAANSNKLTVLVNDQEVSSISAWQYKSHYYIRTRGELIIPSGELITTNVDEFKLYKTPPISGIMIQKDGVMKTNIKLIKEEEGLYEPQ